VYLVNRLVPNSDGGGKKNQKKGATRVSRPSVVVPVATPKQTQDRKLNFRNKHPLLLPLFRRLPK